MTWRNVLLTDSGFFDPFDLRKPLAPIVERFNRMLEKPLSQARVLLIPAVACDSQVYYVLFRILGHGYGSFHGPFGETDKTRGRVLLNLHKFCHKAYPNYNLFLCRFQ